MLGAIDSSRELQHLFLLLTVTSLPSPGYHSLLRHSYCTISSTQSSNFVPKPITLRRAALIRVLGIVA